MRKHEPIPPPIPAPATGLPNPIQPMPNAPPPMGDGQEADAGAYEKGAEAAKQSKEDAENPYPEGSTRAKAYEHGYLDGQKIRDDEKPPRG
jgi:hypothetical protein